MPRGPKPATDPDEAAGATAGEPAAAEPEGVELSGPEPQKPEDTRPPRPEQGTPPAAVAEPPPIESTVNTGAALLTLGRALRADAQRVQAAARPHVERLSGRLAEGFHQAKGKVASWDYSRLVPRRRIRPAAVETPPAEPRADRPRRGPWRRVLAWGAAALGLLIIALIGTMIWALHDVPLDDVIVGTAEPLILLQSADGQPLVQQGPYQAIAAREDYPDHLVQAVLAVEDRRFFQHWGLDFFGVVRALGRNLSAGEVVEGGSTITQQLVKVLHLESSRTIRRKIQEVFLSLWLENRLSKDEILVRYLNSVYMGAGATGIPAAARIYFDKTVSELTLAESAMLAGLISAPSAFNPLENLEAARERASIVLNAMGQAGYLTKDAILEAQVNSAQLRPRRPEMGAGTWFADWVMGEAREIAGPFRGNIRVTTTIIPELQALAEEAIAAILDEEARAQGASQAALVALAPDGAVVAMVGGVDYKTSQFNRAVNAERQPGSTFKLFVYYAALRAGLPPDTVIVDEPVEIDGWTPANFDEAYFGRVSMAEAFARSLNAATVRLGMDVGIEAVEAAARDLGLDAPLDSTPSVLLGASEVTLLDLTGAYASVRAGVAPIEPWGIRTFEAEGGRPFRVGPAITPGRALGEHHDILVGLLALVVDQGTGQAGALDGFAAGKTGTSQDYRDAWFIGFNQGLTVGVWVGNDENEPMDQVTGGKLPALIWQRFMSASMRPGGALVPAAPADSEEASAPTQVEAEPMQCNVRACSRAYRSFRASDCTFQPYRGPRRICEK